VPVHVDRTPRPIAAKTPGLARFGERDELGRLVGRLAWPVRGVGRGAGRAVVRAAGRPPDALEPEERERVAAAD
jgi:hypothetical protein